MKRIAVKYGEKVYIGGRLVKLGRSRADGVNLWVDEDCPVANATTEVVDLTQKLEPFVADVEAAQPINVLRNRKKART